MSFSASDYLAHLSKASHSDYVSSYSALNEVLRTLTIEPQSFVLSKQEFFDQPVNTLFSNGTRQTRAPLGARGSATCCCVQTCQVNWTITIPANTIGIQLNKVIEAKDTLSDNEYMRARTNFNETIVQGKRHCGVFIDISCSNIDTKGENFYYRIPDPITFSGVLDLNQLNPIFNEFPVLTRNYASLYLQLWMTDFLQDLKVVWLNKSRYIYDQHLAYTMIPPEKPDIITLLDDSGDIAQNYYSVRLINCKDLDDAATNPKNSIQQLDNAFFEYLSIHNLCFNVENEMAIIDMVRAQKVSHFPTQVIKSQSSNYPMARFEPCSGQIQSIMSFSNIKAMFMTFAMQQYPTWFFLMLFHNMDLIIDQRHAVPFPYEAHTQATNGSMFQCFVDQDLVSPSSDLYHSLTFENININDKNIVKTYYPNKYILAWKLATDDSFMRGYNSTRIGIVDNYKIDDDNFIPENQNTLAGFMGTRSYPMCWQT
ncbi:MAG: hypothetical protein EZS28_010448 [Streblomastix strix]|uniref:Uncharacterized protein n=1 Tax=Streblomastix strix TaxID=222440 RepID=A0A5J4WGF9_9EUKA|nr:MAG: hypothetical protein EZS28_010448 [Streblomastix strix]